MENADKQFFLQFLFMIISVPVLLVGFLIYSSISSAIKFKNYNTDGLLILINNYRKENNLPEIKINQKLCEFANIRAKEISTDFSHRDFLSKGRPIYSLYCPDCVQMGENLTRSFLDNQSLFNSWLNSKTHKENLDSPYNIGCLGVYKDFKNNLIYVAHIFGQH